MTEPDDRADDLREQIDESLRTRTMAVAELRRALEAFGGSATGLAKAAGVSPSTITRPLKDPRAASLPKWATIVKILDAAGLKPQGYGGPTTAPNNFHLVEVVGEIRPGVWFEDIDERDYGPNLVIVLEPFRPVGSLSAFVVGPEGIPYAPGTRVVVDNKLKPQSGDTLVLRKSQGELIETFAVLFQHERGRNVIYKTGLDGTAQRHAGDLLSKDLPDVGVLMGVVVATVWVKS